MSFLYSTLLALVVAGSLSCLGPLRAQERTRRPSSWQLSDHCRIEIAIVNAQSKSSEQSTNAKCYGISVTKGVNLNIHYSSVHPSLGKPFVTFVLVEGPFENDYPADTAIMMLGQSDEVILEVELGQCRLSRGEGGQAHSYLQCSIATPTGTDGSYIVVIATALFNEGLSSDIRSML
jgi:hypothetical protein